MVSQCVITLGGRGSRFKSISGVIPKPLYPLNEISTLERAVRVLSDQGINRYIFLCGFQAEYFNQIVSELTSKYIVHIQTYVEDVPAGEVGSLAHVTEWLDDTFLFLNGDIVFNIDIFRLLSFHHDLNADISIVTHTSSHPYDSDCILEDSSKYILSYKTKNEYIIESGCFLGNAGLAVLSKSILNNLFPILAMVKKPDLFSGVILAALKNRYRVASYNTSEYLKDMGTPERFLEVSSALANGTVEKLCYKNRQRALFIDRDNTIISCNEGEYITDVATIEMLDFNIKKISLIASSFDLVVCVSNQPQVAMGYCSLNTIHLINGTIAEKCLNLGLVISAFYICPHHPHGGFDNEVSELKEFCFCRKPNPGLLLRASYERNINLSESLFIGDSWRDRECARRAGVSYLDVLTLEESSYSQGLLPGQNESN
jgi:histidinol-phosphate phosphatase family protein